MLIFFLTLDTSYLAGVGPWQMSIGAVLLLAGVLDAAIAGLVTFFYVKVRFSLMKIVVKGVKKICSNSGKTPARSSVPLVCSARPRLFLS